MYTSTVYKILLQLFGLIIGTSSQGIIRVFIDRKLTASSGTNVSV